MVYPVEGGPVWQLGGLGEGPGEYRFAQGIAVGANDSIYLTHDRRSVNVYAPDGRFARSIRSPENLSGPVVPREDGALVVVGGKIDGKPLHVIRETGLIETSFQAEGVILYGPVFDQERVVTPGASGTLWVAERRNYRFQRLSPDGVLERTIGIQPPDSWHSGLFMSMAERDSVTKAGETIRLTGNGPQKQKLAPFFAITGMYEAPDGLLWVSSIVARDGWEDVELKYDRRAFNTLFMNDIVDEVRVKLYRTVVDVIDPETGAVEARAEIDGIGQILNDGTFARTSPTALGVIQIEVFALEVNR